jgi:HAMP domain-containing protein
MKTSIRNTRFTLGIVLFLAIILILSVVSAFYLNKLSKKTSAILKENHYSIVFARDMSKNLTLINQEITTCVLTKTKPDTVTINKELKLFFSSLTMELNNITEIGEEELARSIEKDFHEFHESVILFLESADSIEIVFNLQKKYTILYQKLSLLSEMNAKAIEDKTGEAKVYARKTSIQMSFIGALCLLIAYGFTFSFASYYNERFYQLYNGIKELVASNYRQRLNFQGKDEIYEISEAFNEMADKLSENKQKMSVTLPEDLGFNEIKELKNALLRMKSMENQIEELISRIEKKK